MDEARSQAPSTPGRHTVMVGGLWNAAQVALPLAGTIALSVALGRKLGPDLLGTQSLISYVAGLLAGLLVTSLTKASLQSVGAAVGQNDRDRDIQFVRWGMVGQTLNGALSAFVMVAAGLASDYPGAWFLAGATVMVDAITWGLAVPVIARSGHWTAVARRRLWTQLGAQAAATVAVLAGAGLTAVFLMNLLASAILLAMVARLAGRIGHSLAAFPWHLLSLWGRFAALQLLVQVVAQRIEFIFLAGHSTPAQIAMYSIPFMVVSAIATIPLTAAGSAMPALAARESAGTDQTVAGHLGSAVRVVLAASIPLSLGTAALGPALIFVLYGSQYEQAGQILIWMTPLLLVLPASALCDTYWMARADLRLPLRTGIIGAAVDLAACFILIPRFDALGAAWANLAGQGTTACLILYITIRARHQLRIDRARTAATLLTFAVVAAAAWAITAELPGLLGLVLGALLFLICLVVYTRWGPMFSRKDARWLRHSLPPQMRRLTRWAL